MELGEKLQMLRKERRMSQEKLAEQIHVSRQAISKWEQGIAVPDTDNVVRLSKFFGVPVEFLLSNERDEAKRHFSQDNKMSMNKSSVLIISGIVIEIIAICGAYIMQYCDMAVWGEAYTYAWNYLREMPLVLPVVSGGVCLVVGGYERWKRKRQP